MTDEGLDLSNWDEPVTADTVACFIANGYRTAIIGCQVESIGMQQAAVCLAGGMVVPASYCFLYFGFDGFMGFQDLIALETNKAIRVALARGLRYVALDCEADGVNARPGVTADERVADWRRARQMVLDAGLLPALYTGSYYWRGYMGDVAFDDPLWLANYGMENGQQPPPEPILSVVLGGAVHRVAVHQFASLPALCGRDSRDRNYILEPWWDDMTADEVRAIVNEQLVKGLRQDDPTVPALVGPSSVPSLVAQVVGPDDPTYTDPTNLATIERVHEHLATLVGSEVPEHTHDPGPVSQP